MTIEEQKYQKNLQRLRVLRPIDDDFMRCLFKDNATGKPFEDGAHILYVNGEYRGDSEIGKLMHDFNCTNADQVNFALMAERTRYLKENPKGVSEMCKVLEDMCVEERNEAVMEVAIRMIKAGRYALEEIVNISGLSPDEVKRLQAEQSM